MRSVHLQFRTIIGFSPYNEILTIMCTYLDAHSQLNKMQRILFRSEYQQVRSSENIDVTPLRGNSVRFPRLRLLDQDFESDDVLKNPVSSNQFPSKLSSQIIRTHSAFPKQIYPGDRFIPSRYNHNKEMANYILTKKDIKSSKEHQLNVLEQVSSLSTTWRKKFMHQLMVEENVIPGLRQKQVLHGSHLSSENKSPGNFAEQSKDLWDEKCVEDGMWKSKPRKRPLIGTMESILDMAGFQTLPRCRHLIDWSSRNVIATKIQDAVMFYDNNGSQIVETLQNFDATNVCLMKWNSTGNKLAVCTLSSDIEMYSLERNKIIWAQKCRCVTMFNTPCYARCACWSQNDQHIVTGCKGLISVHSAKDGKFIDSTNAHTQPLVTIAFSNSYRYLASSGLDMDVHILLWPSLTLFLSVYYYRPVKALAWHPQDGDCLCIGGGLGDGSLLLWNVNKVDDLSYRLVKFHGAVENLAWNKRSGELVVHWSYREEQNRYTMIPVFASLDRIVDVIPVDKETRVDSIMWNFDHTQLAIQSNESLTIYNFFGNEYQYHLKRKKKPKLHQVKRDTTKNFKEFHYFNIR